MQQMRIKNTKLSQKKQTWKTGWCRFLHYQNTKRQRVNILKEGGGEELSGDPAGCWSKWSTFSLSLFFNSVSEEVTGLSQCIQRHSRHSEKICFFSYFSLCLYRWILAIKASIKKWLPLHQALQDYMSRPHEETRMWDAVHSVKPDLTHPADHWTNYLRFQLVT